MGHMSQDNRTVTVYLPGPSGGTEVFNACTEVDGSSEELNFTDKNGKQHTFYGVSYQITED